MRKGLTQVGDCDGLAGAYCKNADDGRSKQQRSVEQRFKAEEENMPISNDELAGLMISGQGQRGDYVSGKFVGYTGYGVSFRVFDDDLYAINGVEKGVKPTIVSSFNFDSSQSIFDLETSGGTFVLNSKTLEYGTMENAEGERVEVLMLTTPDPLDPGVEVRFFIRPRGVGDSLTWDSYEAASDNDVIRWSDYFIVSIGGTGGKDTFKSTNADERFFGFGGKDKAITSTGRDYFDGGDGVDTLDFRRATSGVSIYAPEPGESKYDFATGITYLNFENYSGSSFSDYIEGNSQRNVIAGRKGNDALRGGSGDDVFVFLTGDGIDTVYDFEADGPLHDRLDLSGVKAIENWKDLKKHHFDPGEQSVSITGRQGDTIILQDVDVADLGKDNFIF
ncbi:MAG: hypothetical protein KDJ29_19200 [Hyphomicrobiales bacterium]|nr:hypothetical protein [Hyphomicrobiales bacterium]